MPRVSPPPSLSEEQKGHLFPEAVTEVTVKLKVQEMIKDLKLSDNLGAEEMYENWRYLWQMSRHSTNHSLRKVVVTTLGEENYLRVFKKLWKLQESLNIFDPANVILWKNFRSGISTLWNATDASKTVCQQFLESPLLQKFLVTLDEFLGSQDLADHDKMIYFVKAILGILHNTACKVEQSANKIREFEGITILRRCIDNKLDMVRAKGLITLSYIITEEENAQLAASSETIKFIITILKDSLESETQFSTKYGMSSVEITEGLNNIASHDDNKTKIVENGATSLLTQMLGLDRDCQYYSVLVLWSLAFIPNNRKLLLEYPGLVERLRGLVSSEAKTLSHAARGALWEICEYGNESNDNNTGHVMISYQWDSQPVMIKVKERLKNSGYKVWMDVENMSGSTLEAMALAVEKADIILVCLSEKYKTSPSCRTEAEYIYKLGKPIIPLMVEKDYKADGWLGMMVGTKLILDFTDVNCFDLEINKLCRELGNSGHRCMNTKTAALESPIKCQRETTVQAQSSSVSQWTEEQVDNWKKKHDIDDRYALDVETGAELVELKKIKDTCPDSFYNLLLRPDEKLYLYQILRISKAIDELFDVV